jgi:tryptophanase
MPTYPPEPFRIKMIEPIRFIDSGQHERALLSTGNKVFSLKAEDIIIDLLTDSAPGSLSQEQ